jgi:hypothetical protein
MENGSRQAPLPGRSGDSPAQGERAARLSGTWPTFCFTFRGTPPGGQASVQRNNLGQRYSFGFVRYNNLTADCTW